MITAIIVDDEIRSQNLLKNTLFRYCEDVDVVGIGSCVDDAVDLIQKHDPDLVFLDIELRGGNGFSLFDKIKKISFEVIFTTAHEGYAVKAFTVSAIDYLLKPINHKLLIEAVNKLKDKKRLHLKEQRFELLLENISNRVDEFNKIALPISDGYKLVKITDIVYCQADGAYTKIHLLNGERVVSSKILKSFEELLPKTTFFRCHKSYLINLNLAKSYSKADGNFITMETGITIEVSERNKGSFLNVLLQKNIR
ncbi:MAG: response regulator transcription factor [Bacteroidetes bacterium]|nr:response regulator transcription factor [Bacteroidota bacterium]